MVGVQNTEDYHGRAQRKYLSETARSKCLMESVVLVVVRCEVYVCVCGSESGVAH